MDLTITTTTTTPTKFVDTESETPPPTAQPIKPLASINTNGIVRKHHHHHHYHPPPPATAAVRYKECLKNHAASLGAHAVDGCGEFMTSPDCTATDPTSLKCAACGCHRNFHRREHNDPVTPTAATHFLQYHRNPSRRGRASSSSPSPPPSNYGYAPHMLLALSTAVADEQHAVVATPGTPTEVKNEDYPSGRKRFRTKFSQEQKERMSRFAEKLGWKMQRCDDGMVEKFCNEVGIGRSVLKVWMHNNKNTFAKKIEKDNITPNTTTTTITPITTTTNGRIGFDNINNVNGQRQVSTNYGSNSSSS